MVRGDAFKSPGVLPGGDVLAVVAVEPGVLGIGFHDFSVGLLADPSDSGTVCTMPLRDGVKPAPSTRFA